jgi:hypothetical protein
MNSLKCIQGEVNLHIYKIKKVINVNKKTCALQKYATIATILVHITLHCLTHFYFVLPQPWSQTPS